jgi:hypothetical protein
MLGNSTGTLNFMDKQDMMYLVAALALVLIIALFIKPVITGHPVNTGIEAPSTTLPIIITPQNGSETMPVAKIIITHSPPPTPAPSPVPTWNPNATQTVAFVNPSSYGVSFNQSQTGSTRIDNSVLDTNMTTFATISSDTGSSGTTSIMYMPFPYWELVYTVSPSGELVPVSQQVTTTMGKGVSHSGIAGSYSTAHPQFTIQVMDGDDPNRIVRTISPPGGINLDLWLGVTQTPGENSKFKTNQIKTVATEATQVVDPRPWTEKFYEGQRHYYFIITAQSLESYSLQIQVPSRYIGKY